MSAASWSGAVNTRPPVVAVHNALADGRCAVAKFSKFKVWDKVPKGGAFWRYPYAFPKTQRSIDRQKHVRKKSARSVQTF